MLAAPYHAGVTLNKRERQLLIVLTILLIAFFGIEIYSRLYEGFVRIADVVLIFIAAWAFAYLLSPLVSAINTRTRLNRAGAVIVVYAAIALALGGVVAVGLPGLVGQLRGIQERGPELAQNASAAASGIQETLDRAGVPVDLTQILSSLPQRLGSAAGSIAADALGFASATAAILFNTTLVLIIAFIMLLDGARLWHRFTAILSEELRSEADLFRQAADKSFGGFVRGSLLLGLFYGVVSLLYLAPLGVPFAGVLAIIAGLAVIIPFFGPIIAFVPVFAITLVGAPDRLLWVVVVTAVLQQVTLNVLAPRVLGTAVGIHPLFVFLALLLGSRIAGFWGVLLAMPIAGILTTFVRYAYEVGLGRRARTQAALLIGDREAAAAAILEEARREAGEIEDAAAEDEERAARELRKARAAATK
ncbi:AI-2E family transporter [soil metagenome]